MSPGNLINLVLNAAIILFIARAILSWIPIGHDSPFRPVVDVIWRLTEPILAPVRRVLPSLGGLDLSVIVVIIGIRVLQSILG